MTETRKIYDWCNNCESPQVAYKDSLCVACIRTTLNKHKIRLEEPSEFVRGCHG